MSLTLDLSSFVYNDSDITDRKDIPGHAHVLAVYQGTLNSNRVIIQDLPFTAFLTKSIHEFLKTIITLKIWNLPTVQIAGISFHPAHISVAYLIPETFQLLSADKREDSLKNKVLCECARVINLLHHVGFSWNRVKQDSIYVDPNGNIRFCFFTPFPLICLEPEDECVSNSPEYPLKLDILQFGALVWELSQDVTQTYILDRIWNMEVAHNDVWHSVLVTHCLSLVPLQRPQASELCTALGISPETREQAPESLTEALLSNHSDTVLAKLIKGHNLIEKKRFDDAKQCFEGLDNPVAMNNLALILQKSDPKKSAELMIRAADAGYCIAQKNASLCFSKGVGVTKDIELAKQYMKKSAAQGYFEGQRFCWQLLRKYLDSGFLPVLEVCAKKGDNKSILMWATVMKNGYGDHEVDMEKAQWLFMNQTAYDPIGYLFLAKGCEEDRQQAFEHMKKAAEETQCAEAYFELGLMYLKGFDKGVRNPPMAIKLMQKAADLNLPEAMFNIALCKRWGIDMPKDEEGAVSLCNRAQAMVMQTVLEDESRGKYVGEFWRCDGFNGK